MQHLQLYTTLYKTVLVLSWGGNMLRKVESLMVMLSSAYLATSGTPYAGELTMLLCSFLTGTCNKNFGNNCGPN